MAQLFLEQVLNGLQLGVLLFLMAAGLTLVFGIVNFVNLAHGTQFMLGAYLSLTVATWSGSFLLGLAAAALGTLVIGVALERLIFRRLYGRDHLDQVLCTFGVILALNETARLIWGPEPLNTPIPAFLAGQVTLIPGVPFPSYRLAVIAVGLVAALALWLVITRTRAGMLIRAGASNRLMLGLLGVDIPLIYTAIFGAGALLAGLAGAMAAPILAVSPGMGDEIVILAFVVLIIGGLGSVKGAFVGGLLVGLVDTLGRAYLKPLFGLVLPPPATNAVAPALASMLIYLLMAAVLFFRPEGLLPPRGVRAGHGTAMLSVDRQALVAGGAGLPGWVRIGFFLLLAVLPALALALGKPFLLDLVARFMVFGLAALSLDLILGVGGMVSFGHALYLGVGAYVVGILTQHGVTGAAVQWPVAMLAAALIAGLTGLVALRTHGAFFIMITLAFCQMFYYLGVSLYAYGGDDGMSLTQRSKLAGLDLYEPAVFYYLVLAALIAAYLLCGRIARSKFGLALRGLRASERRMAALGYATFWYRLAAMVIAGALCGFAGTLLANSTEFIGPHFMHWTRSGDLMVMVIVGGIGTLFGPLLGSFTLLGLEKYLAELTGHWPIALGLILIAIVLGPKGGLHALLASRLGRRPRATEEAEWRKSSLKPSA